MPDNGTKIIVVYGFLGSGKTTLMLEFARRIVASGKKAAVVVNEAGKVPIDGKLMRVAGLPVREIFAGCICCSVVGDFISTLKALMGDAELAYILVEPSGMADAPRLFDSLEKQMVRVGRKVLVLDGARLPILLQAAGPLIAGQAKTADIILLNKMDAVTNEKLGELESLLKTLPSSSPVYRISARKSVPDLLLNEVL
jgi:G3E family GTPase